MPRADAFKGDGQALDDRRGPVDSAQAAAAQDPPAEEPAFVPGRADPDRRQRSPLVRGPGAGLHLAP